MTDFRVPEERILALMFADGPLPDEYASLPVALRFVREAMPKTLLDPAWHLRRRLRELRDAVKRYPFGPVPYR